MISLTVGYVSGIIAAAIFVLQFVIPNALIVVLVGFLKNEHTAVTWSVVERSLLSSLWPLFLRADSTASRGVDRRIRLLTWLRPLALGLVTIAAVVTPLGLYDDVLPSRKEQDVEFAYMPDSGPMGYGTPARASNSIGYTRVCGNFLPMQCPGTTVEIIFSGNSSAMQANITNDDYDIRIPRKLAELYQSGLAEQPQSVSSFFDIQSRQYSFQNQRGILNNERYVVDSFRFLTSVILNDAIEPVEGLVVNTQTGGIAFRNHTVPVGLKYGAEWTEDLLWIEPETACVDTNISVEFKIPFTGLGNFNLENISLVDNGGFANLITEYPEVNVWNAQSEPKLRDRAYKAAWMANAYTMLVMNITRPAPNAFAYLNSKVGDKYPVTDDQTPGARVGGIYMNSIYNSLLDPDAFLSNRSIADNPRLNYSNPFDVSLYNYSSISTICSGAGGIDRANITNIGVVCGMIFGAARRQDGSKSLVFEPESWWTQPVYSCASTSKASIKETVFRHNVTEMTGNTLRALSVVRVNEKSYADNQSMPLWGVESPPGWNLSDISQLWGLVSPDKENSVNLSTIRAPHLYLPGFGGFFSTGIPGSNNLPAGDGITDLLAGLYMNPYSSSGLPDYTGEANMAMYTKWRDLAVNADSIKKIPDLIWTDLAANMLIGTRSWASGKALPSNLQKRDESSSGGDESTTVPITVYNRRIRYHWPFAIPAFLSLFLFAAVLFAALVSFLSGRGVPARVRHYLFHLSSGRLLGAMQYPGDCDRRAPTKEWIARVGSKPSDLQYYNGDGGANTSLLNKGHITSTGAEKPDGVTQTSEVHSIGRGNTKDDAPHPAYMYTGVPEDEQGRRDQ